MKRWVLAGIVAAASLPADAQTSSVMGTWLTEGNTAHIRLAPCPDASRGPLCGTIARLLEARGADGKPVDPALAVDHRNADLNLRRRRIQGMIFLYDFKNGSEPDSFEGGTIYNPEDGKTYNANVSLQADGRLRLRGYAGLPMFGKTQVWTRLQ